MYCGLLDLFALVMVVCCVDGIDSGISLLSGCLFGLIWIVLTFV